MTKLIKLVKLGALGGVAFGAFHALKRRRQNLDGESSWPTLAETAASDGRSLTDDVDGIASDNNGVSTGSAQASDRPIAGEDEEPLSADGAGGGAEENGDRAEENEEEDGADAGT